MPRGRMQLQSPLHPRFQVPGVGLGPAKEKVANRRSDLRGLRFLRPDLPGRCHRERGGGELMKKGGSLKDPLNIILAGVGGQGNVMASRVLANMLSLRGFRITIGETFGMSQRGGSVMSHSRVSGTSSWSPQIPRGKADIVVALEPIEAVRVMRVYGNPEVKAVLNT